MNKEPGAEETFKKIGEAYEVGDWGFELPIVGNHIHTHTFVFWQQLSIPDAAQQLTAGHGMVQPGWRLQEVAWSVRDGFCHTAHVSCKADACMLALTSTCADPVHAISLRCAGLVR